MSSPTKVRPLAAGAGGGGKRRDRDASKEKDKGKGKGKDRPKAAWAAHRAKVIDEIISSEQVFQGLLLDFLECYYVALCAERELASMEFMSRPSLVGLCSNFEQIAAVSKQMLSELTLATREFADEDLGFASIGEVFLGISALLRLYGQYAENHSAARNDLKSIVQSDSFRAFWDRTETEAMLGRGPGVEPPRMPSTSSTLDGYLILPIQRVPRYLLLLKELIKVTPKPEDLPSTNPALASPAACSAGPGTSVNQEGGKAAQLLDKELGQLSQAMEEVDKSARFMNDCIWRAEQKEILRELQAKFVGSVVDFIGGVGLAGYRALVHEGELVRITSKNHHRAYYFHLMNDALVYSRATGSGQQFRFHRALTLSPTCTVSDARKIDSPAYETYCGITDPATAVSCAFKISTLEKSFVVYAASVAGKMQWMNAIEKVIREQARLEQLKTVALEEAGKPVATADSSSAIPGAAAGSASNAFANASAGAGVAATALSPATATSLSAAGVSKIVKDSTGISAPILQNATADKCQMCHTPLSLFSRRMNCERCGLLVCGTCGSNQRALPGKQQNNRAATAPNRQTHPVCCACTWEMDGTAVDSFVDEFRLRIWVDDVQSLIGGVGGHALMEGAMPPSSASFLSSSSGGGLGSSPGGAGSSSGGGGGGSNGGAGSRHRHADAAEALKRLYFTVSMVHRGEEEKHRGPSNAGSLGPDASFSVPIGLPSDPALSQVMLHVHMVGVGEIGKVPIRVDSIVVEPEVTRAQTFYRWHIVSPNPATNACSTLAVTLVQPTKRDMIHSNLSDKERGALRIGLKVHFELHVPPSLWGSHFLVNSEVSDVPSLEALKHTRTRTGSGPGLSTPPSTTRAGGAKIAKRLSVTSGGARDEVVARLRRFMTMDDPAFTVGGTNVDVSSNGLRGKLNVSLLSDYERRVEKNPTTWGLSLADTLYSDCLAHFGALARNGAPRYSDTQLTLLNRLQNFHSNPVIAKIASISQQQQQEKLAAAAARTKSMRGGVLSSRPGGNILLEAAKRREAHQEDRRPSRNDIVLKLALKAHESVSGAAASAPTVQEEAGEDDDDDDDDEDQDEKDRATILMQLFESEKKYLEDLQTLDEVFATRLLQVVQGSDIRLATAAQTDVWAQKMGLSTAAPTMTTGIQVMNTGVVGRAKSFLQSSSPKKFLSSPLSRHSSSSSALPPTSPPKSSSSAAGAAASATTGAKSPMRLPRRQSSDSPKKPAHAPASFPAPDAPATTNDETLEDERAVATFLRQPFVTVLLQSVGQIRTVNTDFFNTLNQRLDTNPARRFSREVGVGDILERFAGVMPVYSTYATQHPFVSEELTSGLRVSSRFLNDLVTACEANPRCAGKDLKYFLLMPLERVETYRAALSALLMCTPRSHPDWNRMRLALGRIVESTKHMTRAVRKRENLERLREIDCSVENWPEGFRLVDNRRWLVREGALVERQTFGRRETHKMRYFWLFSDCIIMATRVSRASAIARIRSWGSSSMDSIASPLAQAAAAVTGGGGSSSSAAFLPASSSSSLMPSSALGGGGQGLQHRYRFKRIINISDMTICDLPHGVQTSNTGVILGDPQLAFCIACVSGPSFVALVPNDPMDCQSRAGPAPVELARVGPPPTHSIATGNSFARVGVVYEKTNVKSAWLSDLLLCIEFHQRKALFDDDESIGRTPAPASTTTSTTTTTTTPHSPGTVPSAFRVDNPNPRLSFSPVKPSAAAAAALRSEALLGEDESTSVRANSEPSSPEGVGAGSPGINRSAVDRIHDEGDDAVVVEDVVSGSE